jgi:dihydroflavonol-4-reductase
MIFVTGGTGVLGSHLLFHLTREGNKVRATFRAATKIQRVFNLFQYYDSINAQRYFELIEWVNCDVLDVMTLEENMEGCSIVYHCAALVSFQKKDYFKLMKINRQGTANVVNLALEHNIQKLCFVSSTAAVSVNEDFPNAPLVETNKWVQDADTSGYAISKYSSEKEVWRGIEEGLDAVIINPSMLIGPGNWDESSLTILRTIQAGFKFYTQGGNAFVDVRDTVRAMVDLMNSDVKNERFLCTGTNILFKDFFDQVATQLQVPKPTILAGPFLSNFARRIDWFRSLFTGKRTLTKETVKSAQTITKYDSSKLVKTLQFQFTPIEETIQNAINGKLNA